MMLCRQYRVYGRVQGVGFRFFTERNARRLGLSGWVKNHADGSVEILAEGEQRDLSHFEKELNKGPSYSRVERVDSTDAPFLGDRGEFRITY